MPSKNDNDIKVGDTVYFIWLKDYKEIKCTNCDGSGQIYRSSVYDDGDWYNCHNHVTKIPDYSHWVVSSPKKVTHVLTSESTKTLIFNILSYRMFWSDTNPNYGIDVKYCFKTKEEAQAAAKEYTKRLRDAEKIISLKGNVNYGN